MTTKLERLKNPLFWIAALICVAAVICLASFVFAEKGCDISYSVLSYDAETNRVRIALSISNLDNASLSLYIGDVRFSDVVCREGRLAAQTDEISDLVDLEAEGGRITLEYTAALGRLDKHGFQGIAADSFLAFEGSNVFLLPDRCFDIETKHVRRLSARFALPNGWTAVMPFAKGKDGEALAEMQWPSWNDIYAFRKSAFVFGALTPLPGSAPVLLAPGAAEGFAENSTKGFEAIYAYFDGLMGKSGRKAPTFVILPQAEDGEYFIAGAGSESIAATFSLQNSRDWELLGHRLFHAYFEGRVDDISFHAAPKLWFYEGLAVYHELMSVRALPARIQQEAGIGEGDPFQKLFAQYVYMRFKDKSLLTLMPMDEASFSWAGALTEFLHYTQAPLIVRVMEDESFQNFGETDRALKYILSRKKDKDIPLRSILNHALGDDRLFWTHYVAGTEIPPLWQPAPENEDAQEVEKTLNEIEHTLWTWFIGNIPSYPEEKADISQSLKVSDRARSATFADEKTENHIRESLPTVYTLLKARAYRAQALGLSYDDTELRFQFIEDENMDLWHEIMGEDAD